MNVLIILYGESYIKYYEDKKDDLIRKLDYRNSNLKELSNKIGVDLILTTKLNENNRNLTDDLQVKYYNFENNLENLIENVKNKIQKYKYIIISKFNYKINYDSILKLLMNSNNVYLNNGLFFCRNENFNLLEVTENIISLKENNLIIKKNNNFFKEIIDNDILIESLYAVLLLNRNPTIFNLSKIKKTPHYLYLNNNTDLYEKYLSIENKNNHSLEIYNHLINNFDFNRNIIIQAKIKMNRLIIFDGLHRSSILLSNNYKTVKIFKVKKFPLIDKPKYYKLNKIIH